MNIYDDVKRFVYMEMSFDEIVYNMALLYPGECPNLFNYIAEITRIKSADNIYNGGTNIHTNVNK